MEPFFEINEDNKKNRRFTIYGKYSDKIQPRSLEISTNGTNNVYAAVLGSTNEPKILGNLNMSRDDFIDGMLGLFPELRRA